MDERPAASTDKERKDKSLPELISDLARSIPELIRAEIALIRAEVMSRTSLVGQGAGLVVAALIFLSMAIATGTALAIIVFDLFLPLWLAALTITLLWLLIAAVLGFIGVQRFKKLSSDSADKPPAPVGKDAKPGGGGKPAPAATGEAAAGGGGKPPAAATREATTGSTKRPPAPVGEDAASAGSDQPAVKGKEDEA